MCSALVQTLDSHREHTGNRVDRTSAGPTQVTHTVLICAMHCTCDMYIHLYKTLVANNYWHLHFLEAQSSPR